MASALPSLCDAASTRSPLPGPSMRQRPISPGRDQHTGSRTTGPHRPARRGLIASLHPAHPQHIALRDGELIVYRRSRSLLYQCRFKLADGSWVRQTTGKAALEHAIVRACDIYDEARYRQRLGLAHRAQNFAQIAARLRFGASCGLAALDPSPFDFKAESSGPDVRVPDQLEPINFLETQGGSFRDAAQLGRRRSSLCTSMATSSISAMNSSSIQCAADIGCTPRTSRRPGVYIAPM